MSHIKLQYTHLALFLSNFIHTSYRYLKTGQKNFKSSSNPKFDFKSKFCCYNEILKFLNTLSGN